MAQNKGNEIINAKDLNSQQFKPMMTAQKVRELEKLNTLKGLLKIPPDERNQTTLAQIAEATSDVKFLVKYRNQPEYFDICRYLYVKSLDPMQYVFKQGDIGDAFYIILSGGVTILIDEPTEYKNFMQLKETNRLEQGAAFGEIALITNSKRTATIMANQPTELIVLEKEVFQAFVKEKKSLHLEKMHAFLQNINLFTLFPESILLEITTKCQIKRYPSNTIIMRQGDDAAAIYLVRKGHVKAVKQVAFKHDPFTKDKVPFDISDPPEGFQPSENYSSDTDYYFKCDFLEVDEFRDGDIIGEYSVFYQESLEYSAITASPCEVIYITVFDLNKIIPKENFETYKNSLKKYPSERDIRQIYWENKHWTKYRKQMIADINIEKENSKGFMNNLRQSIPRFCCKEIPLNMSDIQIHDNRMYFQLMEEMCNNSLTSLNSNTIVDLSSAYKAAAEKLITDLNKFSGFVQNQRPERKISLRPSVIIPRGSLSSSRPSITQRILPNHKNSLGPNHSRLTIYKNLSNSMPQGFLPPIPSPSPKKFIQPGSPGMNSSQTNQSYLALKTLSKQPLEEIKEKGHSFGSTTTVH